MLHIGCKDMIPQLASRGLVTCGSLDEFDLLMNLFAPQELRFTESTSRVIILRI
jgi:hypothetical protein